jgi:RNA polymerase sigma-70 factor (ECF subfamily)
MNEENVIRLAQQGDLKAYRIIYERYEQPLLRTAWRMLGQQQDAEDAVQEAFLKLYRGIHTYDGSSRFSTFLFRILINTCIDILRKRSSLIAHDVDPASLPHNPSHETRFELAEAIETLPEQMRGCFILFAVEELKQEEVAEIMNLTAGSVKAHIHRAKARLRTLLSGARLEETT